MTDLAGKALGKRYLLHDTLGRGGMGVVYRATDRLTGREVALKQVITSADVLNLDNTHEALDFRLAMAREFRLSSSLRHPNIIQVLDYGFDEERQPFYTMELLPAPQTVLESALGLPMHKRLDLILQMLYALTYLHRRGILHRDLKPANVLVADSTVKVLDFGLSIMRERTGDHDHDSGTTAGTLAYMAPEILMNEPAGVPADLYAVGMMAYEMLAGRHPFQVQDMGTLVNEIMFTMPDMSRVEVGLEVAHVLERLLQKDPTVRYQSAAEVADVLRSILRLPEASGQSAIRESFLQAAALVGRENEVQQLTEALHQAMQQQGSLWLVAGENGVGKSRLLDELRRLAMVQGATVMRGQAVRVGSRPYELWLPVLRWLPLLQPDLSADEIAALQPFIPDLNTLLLRPAEIMPETLPPEHLRARLREALERVLRAHGQPLVILLEDLHWAGSESLSLLNDLRPWLARLPLLVVASYRDDEAPDLAAQLPDVPTMKLRRLSEQSIADLSAAMLGEGGRSPEVVDLLRRESEGNVFFLVEVVRALAEEVGNLEQIGRMTLPQRVFAGGMRTVITRRLEKVDADSRHLLQLAAVMGRELNLKLLRAIFPAVNWPAWLTRCADAAILEVEGDEWRFAHDKLREGLLEDMLPAQRQALHRQVAEGLAAHDRGRTDDYVAALAHHYGQAGDLKQEEYYVTRAGEQALRSGAYHEALEYLRRALRLLPGLRLGPERQQRKEVHVYQRMGEAQQGRGQYAEARRLHTEALTRMQALGDEVGIAVCLGHLGDLALVLDELDEAGQLYEESLARYRAAGNDSGVARTLNRLGNLAIERGDDEGARRLYQESLSLARSLGEEWAMAGSVRTQTTTAAPVALGQSDYAAARTLLETRLKQQTQAGNQAGMADALLQLGLTAAESSDTAGALAYLQQAADLRQRLGDKPGLSQVYERMGSFMLRQSDYDSARRYYRQSLQAAVGVEPALSLHTLLSLARLYLAQGRERPALELLAFLLAFPGSPEALQDAAEALIFDVEARLPAAVVEEAWEAGKHMDLGTLVGQILTQV